MFTTKWTTSERKYDVIVERDVKVRMPDGVTLEGDIYQPASCERAPGILGAHAYNKNHRSPAPMITATAATTAAFSRTDSLHTGATACIVLIIVACTKRRMAKRHTKKPLRKPCATKKSWPSRGCAKRCRTRTSEPMRWWSTCC